MRQVHHRVNLRIFTLFVAAIHVETEVFVSSALTNQEGAKEFRYNK